ncbi:tRNA-dihydrouridine synthase 2, partial [Spiromyces aspiralis]
MTQTETCKDKDAHTSEFPPLPTPNPDWRDRYRDGFFLAPMVRVGTLPMRLLCLEYGADLVWGPEIVDKSIIGCERVYDGGKSIFECHVREKDKLIFQLGTADPELALKAALVV